MKPKTLSYRAISSLCLELSLFLHAGASLANALDLLAEQTEQTALKKIYFTMSEQIDAGSSAAEAFQNAGIFPRDVCGMLRVGEQTGKSEETLLSLSRYYDNLDNADRQMRSAMLWPCVLVAVMMTVAVLLLIYVLPVFEQVYVSLGGQLTGLARILLEAGRFLHTALPVLILLLVAVVGALGFFSASQSFRSRLFGMGYGRNGKLSIKLNTARFAHALSLALAGGLNFEAAVETAGQLLADEKSRQACVFCRARIAEGEEAGRALRESRLLPAAESRLLSLGIQGGAAESTSREIAVRLERDSAQALENAVGRTEPLLVLFCCAVIGVILLAVMLPLAEIMASIG